MSDTSIKRRKILAVLAGGLVLGVGTAAVLAAWNDSEFATGTFASGEFNLEGSTTSATEGFTDHATSAGAALLSYTADASNLVPGDTEYASFWVRLDADTTTDGTLTAAHLETTGLNAEHLAYTITAIGAAATCDATATGTVLGEGSLANTDTMSGEIALLPGADAAPGEAAHLCFEVTAGADLIQDESTTATWQFAVTTE